MKNTFLVTLVFQIQTENHSGKAQFDEQVRMVEADSLAEAWQKAIQLGRNEEDQFENQRNQQVHWKFIAPADVFPLHNISDGGQVYSITHEAEDETSFVEQIREKSRASQSYFAINS